MRTFFGERSAHRLFAALAAVAMPIAIIVIFYLDGKTNILPGEQIIYAESWPETRTDEEIRAKQAVDQERRERAQAERQRQFKDLERRLGI